MTTLLSGSPIIQDGRLIGAVTHVLIGDPTTGYGIFIENMLADTAWLSQRKSENPANVWGFRFFYFDDRYFFTKSVGVMPIYALNCRLKKYTSEKLHSSAILATE